MRIPSAVALAAALLLSACGGDSKEETTHPVLRFSGIPDQDATRLEERFGKVATYLERALGIPVEYVPTRDYQASVEMFANGEIQLAWFGGLTGVQARHRVAGARAIAQGEEDPTFVSYLIAHESTGLAPSDDFPLAAKGMTFTFGSESSTSGRLMPEFYVREHTGGAPEAFFSTIGFSGDHDKTVEIVESGAVQVGAVNFKVYDRRVQEGKTDPDVCRVIWKTPTYADYNFTAHPKLDSMFGAGFIDRLQKALVDMKDPTLLQAFPRESLIPASNEAFEGIRVVAQQLGFLGDDA